MAIITVNVSKAQAEKLRVVAVIVVVFGFIGCLAWGVALGVENSRLNGEYQELLED
jgi:hypothetical protein